MTTTVQPAPLHTATAVTNVPGHIAASLRIDPLADIHRRAQAAALNAGVCINCGGLVCPGCGSASERPAGLRPDEEWELAALDEAQAADFFDEAVAQ